MRTYITLCFVALVCSRVHCDDNEEGKPVARMGGQSSLNFPNLQPPMAACPIINTERQSCRKNVVKNSAKCETRECNFEPSIGYTVSPKLLDYLRIQGYYRLQFTRKITNFQNNPFNFLSLFGMRGGGFQQPPPQMPYGQMPYMPFQAPANPYLTATNPYAGANPYANQGAVNNFPVVRSRSARMGNARQDNSNQQANFQNALTYGQPSYSGNLGYGSSAYGAQASYNPTGYGSLNNYPLPAGYGSQAPYGSQVPYGSQTTYGTQTPYGSQPTTYGMQANYGTQGSYGALNNINPLSGLGPISGLGTLGNYGKGSNYGQTYFPGQSGSGSSNFLYNFIGKPKGAILCKHANRACQCKNQEDCDCKSKRNRVCTQQYAERYKRFWVREWVQAKPTYQAKTDQAVDKNQQQPQHQQHTTGVAQSRNHQPPDSQYQQPAAAKPSNNYFYSGFPSGSYQYVQRVLYYMMPSGCSCQTMKPPTPPLRRV